MELEVVFWLPDASAAASPRSEADIAIEHTVGLRLHDRSMTLAIEAEDALIAALKAKQAHPEASITYVRRSNRRGDRRHPHGALARETKSAP